MRGNRKPGEFAGKFGWVDQFLGNCPRFEAGGEGAVVRPSTQARKENHPRLLSVCAVISVGGGALMRGTRGFARIKDLNQQRKACGGVR